MNEKIRKLLADRAKLITDQRALLDKADVEKRSLTADENTNYENMDAEFDRLTRELEREQKLEERQKTSGSTADLFKTAPDSQRSGEQQYVEYRGLKIPVQSNAAIMQRAFNSFLSRGIQAIVGEELRALQADADIYGGFLVAPQQFVMKLIQAMDNEVFIRAMATVMPVTKAESLGAPSLDNDPADPSWTAEIATGTEDSTMSFGKRELTPHPLAKLIKISEKLLRVSAMDVESLVIQRLAYKFAVTAESAYLNGTGNNQPMGVFTAATAGFGISTSRDVSTGNAATAFTTDGLMNALYSLKAQYHPKAQWIFHRDAIKMLRKLKDGEGQYIWNPDIKGGQPDMILGRPYKMSEYCPATFTTGLYVGIVGDFSNYWIADALSMRVQRLNELYAATNQVGFIGRLESDGMPVLEEAFARVKLG
jgi:HK97 family phage major capsid protein